MKLVGEDVGGVEAFMKRFKVGVTFSGPACVDTWADGDSSGAA